MKASNAVHPIDSNGRVALIPRRFAAVSAGVLLLLTACAGNPKAPDTQAGSATNAAGSANPATDGSASKPNSQTANRKSDAGSNKQATGAEKSDLPGVTLDSAILFQLMAADIAAQRGQAATAFATFMSLALKTSDPRLARRALEIALREQDTDSALDSARLWARLAPNDPQANQSLTVLLVTRGMMDEARPRIKARLDADRAAWFKARKNGSAMPEDTPWENAQRLVIRSPNRFESYQLLVDLFEPDLKEPAAQRVLASQAHFAGAHAMAVDHARRLLALDPSANNTLMLAQYQQSLPDGSAQSIRTLEKFNATNPDNIDISTALARLYTLNQQWDKARALFEPILKKEPDNAEILYILAGLALQMNDRSAAGQYLDRYIAKAPEGDERDLTALLLSLAQLSEDEKAYPEALQWLDRVKNPAAAVSVRIRKAQLMAKQGKVDTALGHLRRDGALTDNDKLQIILTEAQILREADRLTPAAKVLSAALSEMPDNPDLLYEDAMLAEKQQQHERVERNLRKVINQRPDNPHAYNALGYSFADRNIRLDEAKVLIDRASELAPNDAYIMDSLGWILYRQGKVEEALSVLRKAFSIKPDPEIAIHIGEVLWKTGEKEEAVRVLRGVKDNAGTAQIFKETVGRLGITGL